MKKKYMGEVYKLKEKCVVCLSRAVAIVNNDFYCKDCYNAARERLKQRMKEEGK